MVSSSWLAALCKQLLCLKVTARFSGSGCGLILGRQAAWRLGAIGMVSSSWLAALCRQLLCLKVTARYLGSDCGLKLGRQAAWRPGTIGIVSSGWLAALCKQSLFSDCEVWALVAGFGTARCRPRNCLNVQSVSYAQEGTLNKFLVDGRVRCSHAGGARQCRIFCSSSEDSNDGKELLRH